MSDADDLRALAASQRNITDAFGLDANGMLSTAPEAIAKRAELMESKGAVESSLVSPSLPNLCPHGWPAMMHCSQCYPTESDSGAVQRPVGDE